MSRQKVYRERVTPGEDLDPTPMELAVQAPPSIRQLVQQHVRQELSRQFQAAGLETFEEADDFEEEDPEPEFISRFEVRDMPPEPHVPRETLDGEDGPPVAPPPAEGDSPESPDA